MNVMGQVYVRKQEFNEVVIKGLLPYVFLGEDPRNPKNSVIIAMYSPGKKRDVLGTIQFIPELAPLIRGFVGYCYRDDIEGRKAISEANMPLDLGTALESSGLFVKNRDFYVLQRYCPLFDEEALLLGRVLNGESVEVAFIDFTEPYDVKDVIAVNPASALTSCAPVKRTITLRHGAVSGRKKRNNFLSEAAEKTFG